MPGAQRNACTDHLPLLPKHRIKNYTKLHIVA